MTFDPTRRALIAAAAAAPWALSGCASGLGTEIDLHATLQGLQAHVGGKLGVFALNTRNGDFIGFNAESRFAMCSTFKVLLVAAVLARVDAGELSLDQPVRFGRADLVAHSPVTSNAALNGRASVRDLASATVELSDNTAANLLLTLLGGPSAITDYARSTGDWTTRLDRFETELNTNLPGDLRDTTTPLAMGRTLRQTLLGSRLSEASRAHLAAWMVASPTGARRLRAGLPGGWAAGDKTGTGANGAVNDVAVVWPPGKAPLVLCVYMTGSSSPLDKLEAAHAVAARVLVRALMAA